VPVLIVVVCAPAIGDGSAKESRLSAAAIPSRADAASGGIRGSPDIGKTSARTKATTRWDA
jgi:hypothetical protein